MYIIMPISHISIIRIIIVGPEPRHRTNIIMRTMTLNIENGRNTNTKIDLKHCSVIRKVLKTKPDQTYVHIVITSIMHLRYTMVYHTKIFLINMLLATLTIHDVT